MQQCCSFSKFFLFVKHLCYVFMHYLVHIHWLTACWRGWALLSFWDAPSLHSSNFHPPYWLTYASLLVFYVYDEYDSVWHLQTTLPGGGVCHSSLLTLFWPAVTPILLFFITYTVLHTGNDMPYVDNSVFLYSCTKSIFLLSYRSAGPISWYSFLAVFQCDLVVGLPTVMLNWQHWLPFSFLISFHFLLGCSNSSYLLSFSKAVTGCLVSNVHVVCVVC